MEYKYLNCWVQSQNPQKISLKKILKFQNQYLFTFLKQNEKLQLSFNQSSNFCFWTCKNELPFEEKKDLNTYNDHLYQSKLINIKILHQDRILAFEFSKVDIYNKVLSYLLIVELIPRFENIILTKKTKDGLLILDCHKKISFSDNSTRQILPGIVYSGPQTNFKVDKSLVTFPLKINTLLKNHYTEMEEYNKSFDNINDYFEDLYYNHFLKNFIINQKKDLLKRVNKDIQKKKKKILTLTAELQDAEMQEKWKKYAELIKINLNEIKPGANQVILTDYYSEKLEEILVPLLPDKKPLENMSYYFKKYKKAKNGKTIIQKQIQKTNHEIDNLEKELWEIDNFDSLSEILTYKEKNYKFQKTTKQNMMAKKSSYKSIEVDSDWRIFIGRSNKENDVLTTKFAKPEDWWFHTRIFHGTHVLLKNYNKREITDKLIGICSGIAAYYSKAKHSSNVPVDYTKIKYVTKPSKSPPGYVIYKNQKTVYVNPINIKEACKLTKTEDK